jgi:uncharacterized membrane protein
VGTEFMLAGVIWMLGWCMILLASLTNLKPLTVSIIGIVIILGQQVFSLVPALLPDAMQAPFRKVWEFIYPAGFKTFPGVNILYVLVPWIGVMAAGYGFGHVLHLEEKRKKQIYFSIGLTAVILFLVIGSIQVAKSEPNEFPFVLRVLNQNKYPASILFLMMTLGPTILLMSYADRAKGWLSKVFITIGRVPFFYYLLHILTIHISALLINQVKFGDTHQGFYVTAPYTWLKGEYVWSLPLHYIVFLINVIILYYLCRWYASYKQAHKHISWLKYI